jgi:hypothetical protein
MNPYGMAFQDSTIGYTMLSFSKNKKVKLPLDKFLYKLLTLSLLEDSLLYINESSGSIEFNINTGQSRRYLPGIPVSRVFRDQAGDLWFTTLGEGIFRLNSSEWKTIRPTAEGQRSMVTAITKIGNELWIGDNHNYIFRYALPDVTLKFHRPYSHHVIGRILHIDTVDKNKVLSSGDLGIMEGTRDFHFTREFASSIKSVRRINNPGHLFHFPMK